jgi:hypothetical protein
MITLSLDGCIDAVHGELPAVQEGQGLGYRDDFDLIVLGASLPESEPAAMLYRRRGMLDERLDAVPLLIVSPRSFYSDPRERIFCSELPFDREQFQAQIFHILNG